MPSPPFPNQSGTAATYVTPGGTQCWNFLAYAGGTIDNFHLVRVITPKTTPSPVPVVFVLHGVGADQDIITSGHVGRAGMTDAFLDQGWVVVSAAEGGITWGNEAARVGMVDITTWAGTIWANNGFMIYGVSMGGCAGLNYLLDAQLQSFPVVCYAGNSPATNLGYTYTNNSTLRPGIASAYSLISGTVVDDPDWTAKVTVADGGHDPQGQAATLFPVIPFRFYASYGDTTIKRATNADAFAAKLDAAAWPLEHEVVGYSGGHVADASFQVADTIAFFQRALGIVITPPPSVGFFLKSATGVTPAPFYVKNDDGTVTPVTGYQDLALVTAPGIIGAT